VTAVEDKPKRQDVDIIGRWVLVATISASSMGFLNEGVLSVAIQAMQEGLGATLAQALWVTVSYRLVLSGLILLSGALGDHFGRRRIFLYGIWIFTVGAVLCGFAPTVELLIAARTVQGFGGAMMIPGSLAIISAYFDDTQRGGAIGLWSAATAVTTVGGPFLGGVLVSIGFWRGVFFMVLPLAAVALYAVYRYVPESRDEEAPEKMDYIGGVIATLGLSAMTFGFIQAGDNGFNATNIGVLVAGIAVLAVFVWWENRIDYPMMPLKLFRSPVFSGANLLTLFLYGALGGVFFFFTLNLVQAQGYREDIAGLAGLPFPILLILMSQRAGAIADRIGPRIPLTLGPALTGVGFMLLAFPALTAGASDYFTTYFPGMVVAGIGMGIVVAPLTTAVMGSVPQHSAGTASGINNAASRTAGVLTLSVLGAVMLLQFVGALETRTADIDLSESARAELIASSENLGNTQVPDGLDAATAEAVAIGIKLAFVDTFRTAAWIGAFMCWISAAFAWVTMRMTTAESRERIEGASAVS
jgi:EmrB/QacA subfamily drug resistance transporter